MGGDVPVRFGSFWIEFKLLSLTPALSQRERELI